MNYSLSGCFKGNALVTGWWETETSARAAFMDLKAGIPCCSLTSSYSIIVLHFNSAAAGKGPLIYSRVAPRSDEAGLMLLSFEICI